MKFPLLRPPTRHLLCALFAAGMIFSCASSYSNFTTYGSSFGFTESTGLLQVTAVTSPTPEPTPSVLKQIPSTLIPASTNGVTINLTQFLTAPPASTNFVVVNSSMGNFCIQLFPTNAPATTANFLDYVNQSSYQNMLVHRSVPGFVIQTGGYTANGSLSSITTLPSITNEFGISNTRGTVAMALVGSNPNSATSQWFINLTNNSSVLDATNIAGNPPFTVFGQVIGNGMSVVDAIASLPTDDFQTIGFSSVFSTVPLQSWAIGGPIYLTNLVVITNVLTLPYFISNPSPNVFSTQLQGTNLVIKYLGTKNTPPLTVPVTLTAYAADTNGNTVQSSFQVSERKIFQSINFSNNITTYSASNAVSYIITNLPSASSGLPVTITIASGPAKNFRVLTNQVVTMVTNQIISTNIYYVTNTITNNISFTNSITLYTTNPVTNSFTNIFTNSTISLTGAGNVALVAHQPGNAVYYPAQNQVGYVTVYKALQKITFLKITDQTGVHVPAPILPWRSPTSDSGLPVSVTVKSGPAKANKSTDSSSTPFQLTGSGTVTLVASQNGNAGYYAARPVTNSFVVTAINGNSTTKTSGH